MRIGVGTQLSLGISMQKWAGTKEKLLSQPMNKRGLKLTRPYLIKWKRERRKK